MIVDIHTHADQKPAEGVLQIKNIRAGIDDTVCTYPFSYGVHPYDVEKVDIGYALSKIDETAPFAIGEIGMDFRFQETAAKQSIWFRLQIEKAEDTDKPVIIHAVKSLPQVLSILATHRVSFVIHGFRGTIKQAEEIVKIGGFFSISPVIPIETKRLFDSFGESMLLETDETGVEIKDHYSRIAEVCAIPLPELETIIEKNFTRWRGNRGPCFF